MEKGKAVMGSGRRWAIDFTNNSTTPSSRDIPDPPGFTRASQDQDDSTTSRQKKDAEANWKAQKAWEVAQAPFKNLLMMGFMMWMAGSTVHLFSIGITFSALWQPISALQGVGKGKPNASDLYNAIIFLLPTLSIYLCSRTLPCQFLSLTKTVKLIFWGLSCFSLPLIWEV
ncbi:ER membrane protein complex subunit 4-like isoform X2 [Mangifera indica]|uniref:ER membrane protein complex subunit 4-like isoform X2 n=1 Tax=Mangifera indica TaxID=29780 RepID=UPI001CFA0E57|nr:ER membrane protein complex subunit 4-like isoform X2 [Mangifera indica]